MKNIKHHVLLLVALVAFKASGQSLKHLIDKALQNNAGLKAWELEYRAALSKTSQVGQLPNPTVAAGISVLNPETRVGGQVFNVSLNQMFPWFGTLNLKKDVANTMAKGKYYQIEQAKADLIFNIKNAYYQLFLIQKKQNIYRTHLNNYAALKNITLAKLESGKHITTSDVLIIQRKVEEVATQISLLNSEKQIYAQIINAAINHPTNTPIDATEPFDSLAAIPYDRMKYIQEIQAFHPALKQVDTHIEISKKKTLLHALEAKPSFGIGLDYRNITKRTDADPFDNGKDILIPKISFNIPLDRKKYHALTSEEQLLQKSYLQRKDQLIQEIISQIQTHKVVFEQSVLKFQSCQKQLTLTASMSQILLSEYSEKGIKFDALIQVFEDVIKYEIEKMETIVQSHTAKIAIEHLADFDTSQ